MSRTLPRQSIKRLEDLLQPAHLYVAGLVFLFAIIQIATSVQYHDGPRNLHHARVVAENPAFLVGATDPYDMVNGWVPEPSSLAPLSFARDELRSFNAWWGPVPIALMALAWRLTGSHVAMALVAPVAAGLAIVLSYRIGTQLLDRRSGLIIASFIALFPLFFEHSINSYAEPISLLFLTLAIWSYLQQHQGRTLIFGIIAALCKLDVIALYGCVIGCSLLYRIVKRQPATQIGFSLIALVVPLATFSVWRWLIFDQAIPSIGMGLSVRAFLYVMPDMLTMLFYLPWYGAVLTLTAIGACVVYGVRSTRLALEVRLMLLAWLGGSFLVLLVYSATPIAGNSPRIILPALPALAILFAAGLQRIPANWSRRIGFYILALFLVINSFLVYYMHEHSRYTQTFHSVWKVLREQPRGFVLTHMYWPTAWQTGQPVTWFEWDPQFQRNILHNREHFAQYVTTHPIRYVIVPRPNTPATVNNPIIPINTINLYSPEVIQYLEEHATRIPVPDHYDLYQLPDTNQLPAP